MGLFADMFKGDRLTAYTYSALCLQSFDGAGIKCIKRAQKHIRVNLQKLPQFPALAKNLRCTLIYELLSLWKDKTIMDTKQHLRTTLIHILQNSAFLPFHAVPSNSTPVFPQTIQRNIIFPHSQIHAAKN